MPAPASPPPGREYAQLRQHETFIPAMEVENPEPILVLGERGTSKDLIARYLHAYCSRHKRPLVVVNCAEITDELAASRFFGHKRGSFTGALTDEPGFFRAADGGVLFLDEIAELSPRAQAHLLRVLENHTVTPVGQHEGGAAPRGGGFDGRGGGGLRARADPFAAGAAWRQRAGSPGEPGAHQDDLSPLHEAVAGDCLK